MPIYSFPVSLHQTEAESTLMENSLVRQGGINVSNLPMFSLIFSDLNILFPLPRALSTSHSCPLLLQGENPRFKLRWNFPPAPKDCRRALLRWPLCAPSDGPLRTEELSPSYWECCCWPSLQGNLQPMTGWCKKSPPSPTPPVPPRKGHPRFRACCGFGWGLCCENIATQLPPLPDPASFPSPQMLILKALHNKLPAQQYPFHSLPFRRHDFNTCLSQV